MDAVRHTAGLAKLVGATLRLPAMSSLAAIGPDAGAVVLASGAREEAGRGRLGDRRARNAATRDEGPDV
jgi:hypothetical protein